MGFLSQAAFRFKSANRWMSALSIFAFPSTEASNPEENWANSLIDRIYCGADLPWQLLNVMIGGGLSPYVSLSRGG
jgi:hypothetical protein